MPIMEKGLDRTLRLHTIFLWIPAFALLLAHGIKSGLVCPALGILPMSFSAATGFVHYIGHAKSPLGNFIMDAFCSAFLFSILVPAWVLMSRRTWGWMFASSHYGELASATMLGTYGTVPMLVNLFIHLYFAARAISAALRAPPKTCPHCHGVLGKSARRQRGAYASVPEYDDDHDVQDALQPETAEVECPHNGGEKVTPTRFNGAEPEPSSSNMARPSTDDETARLV